VVDSRRKEEKKNEVWVVIQKWKWQPAAAVGRGENRSRSRRRQEEEEVRDGKGVVKRVVMG